MNFTLAKSTGYSADKSSEIRIKQVNSSIEDYRTTWGIGSRKEFKLKHLVKKASQAYVTDALVRQAVDKYAENFRDFDLVGSDEQVNYLKNRLNLLSLKSGEHWKTTFARIINEYFKTGNAFIVKFRGGNFADTKRALYKNNPYPIGMLALISAERLEPVFNNKHRFVGWRLEEFSVNESIDLKLAADGKSYVDKTLLEIPALGEVTVKGNVFRPGLDIVQVAYKKGANSNWGIGLTLVSLEDIALLRTVEQTTAVMIKKFSNPIIHHKILRASSPMSGIQNEIDSAYRLHKQAAPDGVIITGGNTEISAIGSESQAMRVEGYLKYFLDRAFAGLGVSQSVMGIGSMSMGAAEAANEMLMTKVRYCQKEIARELEFFILNELLWEGGFDPYRKAADVVSIQFVDIDEDREIKRRTHAADLFQKNYFDHGEARNYGGEQKPAQDDQLHVNKIRKAEVDHETQGAVLVNRSKPVSTVRNNKEKFRDYIARYVPDDPEEVENFLQELKWHFSVEKVEPLFEAVVKLVGDKDAIIELLVESLF